MPEQQLCHYCGNCIEIYKNPVPTVDTIIYTPTQGVVLISRKNSPLGFALPGGFVDYGETIENAAIREAYEETGLKIFLQGVLGVYSQKDRDPRLHTISTVFVANSIEGTIKAGDDAASAAFYHLEELPPLAFDHLRILKDFIHFLCGTRTLAPIITEEDSFFI